MVLISHLLSKQLGTSTTYIDETYSHIQVETNTERITRGYVLDKNTRRRIRISLFITQEIQNKLLCPFNLRLLVID